ncbi:hypothetical protein [Paraburkholderia tropica]|uniref:hypothetical protein n=1 Tax=Paraburkholderia tropica TaxID=92647 RepID=UPI002AB27818|nr:hypothetical protein [Paraburkholderia tropica]
MAGFLFPRRFGHHSAPLSAIHASRNPARIHFAIFFAISMRSESARLPVIGIYHQTFLKSADITIEHK